MRRTGVRILWIAATAALSGSIACSDSPAPAAIQKTVPAPVVVTGKVETSDGSLPVAGRGVDAVNLETGDRYSVLTNREGGFAMKLLPGTWRLELRLEPGESLAKSPAPITVAPALSPSALQFRVTPVSYRPHRPAKLRTTGLGSPVA